MLLNIMKDVRIKINRLGAVTNSEIILRPLMLFMGESGLGKSYVAFLAHYVYVILSMDRMRHFFENINIDSQLENAKSGEVILSISTSALFKWINSDAISYIRYIVGHDKLEGEVDIEWPFADREISFVYHQELEGLTDNEEMVYTISSKNFTYNKLSGRSQIDTSVFEKLVQAELTNAIFGKTIKFNDYILPPSRAALLELTERSAFRSGMYEEFFKLKADLNRPQKTKKEDDTILERLLEKVNDGHVVQIDNQLTYTTVQGIPMPLTAAASSVKELAPFTMLLKKFLLNRCSILFEEPEAHLHPERQKHVADLIGYAVNEGCHMQVTTHSDYFIKRLNLLIRLYRLSHILSQNKINEFLKNIDIESQSLLDPTIINAYYLYRRENGSSGIKFCDIKKYNMIPFDSFNKAIMNDFEISDKIDDLESAD